MIRRRALIVAACAAVLLSGAWRLEARGGRGVGQEAPARPVAATLLQDTIDTKGLAAGRSLMDEMRAKPAAYTLDEQALNTLGYRYLGRNAFPEALAVFEFNVKCFPSSDNVYDSLAEAAVKAGDQARLEATLAGWQRAAPAKPEIVRRISDLRALQERYEEERRLAYKPGQPTGLQGPYLGQPVPGTEPRLFAKGLVSLAFFGDYAPTFAPDGREFYFTRSTEDRQQTIMVSRLGKDGWTVPEPFSRVEGFNAHEPHISLDGKRIYWGWMRPIPPGEPNVQNMDYGIWACERTSDGWSQPAFVGQAMFVTTARSGAVYATDHRELPDGYLARMRMVNGKFDGRDRFAGAIDHLRSASRRNMAHPGIAPDESYVLFDFGGQHLYVSFHQADGTWSEATDLADHGIPADAGIASVTPDGKYIFFGREGDLYWVSTALIDTLRPR